jgi:adenine-specific DNA-methyltransferase
VLNNQLPLFEDAAARTITISDSYTDEADISLWHGDRIDLLQQIPDGAAQLVVTSPPYNLGKEYEELTSIDEYVASQEQTIFESVRCLSETGSICWQVGNYVNNGEIIPIDTLLFPIFRKLGLKMRNRVIWYFGHGLHTTRRFSGRYETIIWFTKSNDYYFDLEPVRVPQKYPGKKAFRGERKGEYTSNPNGKNPSDIWEIPNVKANHVEKTEHPCQFPVELIERLVLSMSREGDLVIDPYMGVGSTAIAAFRHNRKAAGADMLQKYLDIAKSRLQLEAAGLLKTRPMDKPVHIPDPNTSVARNPFIK